MTQKQIAIAPESTDIGTPTSERRSSDWDIRNAPRNYISLVIFQGGSALFSFGAVWLIARHLGSEGYGGIVAIIAASQIAQVFVNWTGVAVVRLGMDEFIDTEKIARTFWVRLIILSINLLLVLSLAGFWFPPLADWLKLSPNFFWLIAVHFSVAALWIHVQMSLQGVKLPRVHGFLQMVERVLIFAFFLILIAVGRLDFFWVMVCYIAVPAAMVLIGLVKIRNYIFSRFSIDRQFIKRIVVYSAPLAPAALVGLFSGSYIDTVLISIFLSTKDLGIYSIATQVNGIVLQFPTLANFLLITLFITLQKERQTDKIQLFFKDLLPSVVLLGGVACTVIAFFCWLLIPIVFGVEFAESTTALWILLTASATALPVLIGYSAVAQAKSATTILMVASICAALANVFFNFLLIPIFGIKGCAWATVAAYFVGSLTYSVYLRKRYNIPVSWVFLAMFPAVAAAATFTQTESPKWPLLVCALSAILIIYLKRSSIGTALDLLKSTFKSPFSARCPMKSGLAGRMGKE